MGSFCVSILTTNALKKVLKSNKIKKNIGINSKSIYKKSMDYSK